MNTTRFLAFFFATIIASAAGAECLLVETPGSGQVWCFDDNAVSQTVIVFDCQDGALVATVDAGPTLSTVDRPGAHPLVWSGSNEGSSQRATARLTAESELVMSEPMSLEVSASFYLSEMVFIRTRTSVGGSVYFRFETDGYQVAAAQLECM